MFTTAVTDLAPVPPRQREISWNEIVLIRESQLLIPLQRLPRLDLLCRDLAAGVPEGGQVNRC